MRPLRSLLTAVVVLSPLLLPATSIAAYHSWCQTGDALSKDGGDATTQNPIVKWVCENKDATCCTGGSGTLRWSMDCVQWAAEYAKDPNNTTLGDYCGRYAWTQGPLPNSQQSFPRDFSLVALSGDVNYPLDVRDPIAAKGNVTANSFSLNSQQREPYAVVAGGAVTFCNGTVYGNVRYSGDYADACYGNQNTATYLPPGLYTHQQTSTLPVDFDNWTGPLTTMSSSLKTNYTPSAVTQNGCVLWFIATDKDMNVFNVDASKFNNTCSYKFNVPSTSAVIVNIIPVPDPNHAGQFKTVTISNSGVQGVGPGNLLWNLSDNAPLAITSMDFYGSILAPNSQVTLKDSKITGSAVAASITLIDSELHVAPYHVPATPLALAQQYIKHVVIIMQENRSFDTYFGYFPGANGVSSVKLSDGTSLTSKKYSCTGIGTSQCACKQDPNGTIVFKQNQSQGEQDCPHYNANFQTDCPSCGTATPPSGNLLPENFLTTACQQNLKLTADELNQVLGYHVGNVSTDDVYNYWQFAKNFVLQDNMFASAPSWSPVEHNFLVSGWNANLPAGATTWVTSFGDVPALFPAPAQPPKISAYPWANLTSLLDPATIPWKYYSGNCWDYSCPGNCCSANPELCVMGAKGYLGKTTCGTSGSPDLVNSYWNQLQNYQGVNKDKTQATLTTVTLGDGTSMTGFYDDVNDPTGSSLRRWTKAALRAGKATGSVGRVVLEDLCRVED